MSFFRWSRVCSKGDVAALLQIIEENGAETVVTLKNVAGWTLLYHTAMELGKPSGSREKKLAVMETLLSLYVLPCVLPSF